MNVYITILMILEKKGPATIPSIWREMNIDKKAQFEPAYLQSVIYRKKELFIMAGDVVSIRPEKDPVQLTFKMDGYPGPDTNVRINFKRNTFIYLEWHFNNMGKRQSWFLSKHGSVEDFKKSFFSLNIWDWDENYQKDGIIVGGTGWSVVLETKGGVYKSKGLDSFPEEWFRLYQDIARLTGVKLR